MISRDYCNLEHLQKDFESQNCHSISKEPGENHPEAEIYRRCRLI